MTTTRDANFWREECNFCTRAADSKGLLKAFNYDTACFVRYLSMQRDTAERDGFHDTVTYLQHIIDDMTKEVAP